MRNKISMSDNIRLMREQLGYSQEYVATRLGITQQSYSSIEKNPEEATLMCLKEIASILEVSFVTLLGEGNVYIQQNFHQQGGNAATQMNVASTDKEVYEKYIAHLKDQIDFLQSLIKSNQ